MMNRKHAWLLIPALAFSLTACTGGEDTDGNPEGNTSDSSTESYVDITDTPGTTENFVGALEDAEESRCEAAGDGWVSEGTVKNPTDVTQSYRLYVSFNEKRDTKGLVQVDVADVAPGESATWSAEADVKGNGIECVLRVERFGS